jgi:hypothetical protein
MDAQTTANFSAIDAGDSQASARPTPPGSAGQSPVQSGNFCLRDPEPMALILSAVSFGEIMSVPRAVSEPPIMGQSVPTACPR